jgi:hypothetical protein
MRVPPRIRSIALPLLLAALAWPGEGGEAPAAPRPAVEMPEEVRALVAEATAFNDGLADDSKRRLFQRVAAVCDPGLAGCLQRPMDAPRRFGALRLYPRAYDLAKRVAALPLEHQQRLYAYVYAHQVRSGWVVPTLGVGGGR